MKHIEQEQKILNEEQKLWRGKTNIDTTCRHNCMQELRILLRKTKHYFQGKRKKNKNL